MLSIFFVYLVLFLLNTQSKCKGAGFKRLFLRDTDGLLDDGCPAWSYLQFIQLRVGYKRELLPSKYGASLPVYKSTRKYMHAETLALLTKPLYFPNMKYLKLLSW